MSRIYGNFIEHLPQARESLELGFGVHYHSNKERWENNFIVAQFCSNYFATFLLNKQLRYSIQYIANELLENAIKFNKDSKQHINLNLYLLDDKMIISAVNTTDKLSCIKLQELVQKILTDDPLTMYIEQVKSSTEVSNISGLGLLTILNDHGAELGWEIQDCTDEKELLQVKTMAQLNIE